MLSTLFYLLLSSELPRFWNSVLLQWAPRYGKAFTKERVRNARTAENPLLP